MSADMLVQIAMTFVVVLMVGVVFHAVWQARLAMWEPAAAEPIEHHHDHHSSAHGGHEAGGHGPGGRSKKPAAPHGH